MRKVIPGAQARSGRPLSGAAIANGFVFVSGQTFAEGADVEAQTRGALDKIAALLKEAGTDLSQAMRCTAQRSLLPAPSLRLCSIPSRRLCPRR